jgi:hypothetical protein
MGFKEKEEREREKEREKGRREGRRKDNLKYRFQLTIFDCWLTL